MTPKKRKKYALSIEILGISINNPIILKRGLTMLVVEKQIKSYLVSFVETGVKFTVTEDWGELNF